MENRILPRYKARRLTSFVFVFLLVTGATISNAQTPTDMVSKNKLLIKEGFQKWSTGTGNFFDLLDPDLEWTIAGSSPLSKTYHNKKEFIDQVIDPLNRRLSKRIVPTVKAIYADGDIVTAIWDGVATARDGKPYNATYCWNMQIKNGKIIKVLAFLDGIEFTDIMTRIKE